MYTEGGVPVTMVWNRRSTRKGGRLNPPDEWVWSPKPTHEPIVTMEMWRAVAEGRKGSRNGSGATGNIPLLGDAHLHPTSIYIREDRLVAGLIEFFWLQGYWDLSAVSSSRKTSRALDISGAEARQAHISALRRNLEGYASACLIPTRPVIRIPACCTKMIGGGPSIYRQAGRMDLVLLEIDRMPRVEGLETPRDLYWVLKSPPLVGMRLPRPDFPWARLHDAGVGGVVCLVSDEPGYDPTPLRMLHAERLQDLLAGGIPEDPEAEETLIRVYANVVVDHLGSGTGVAVHCVGGNGRTGTVLGVALVSLGYEAAEVAKYLQQVNKLYDTRRVKPVLEAHGADDYNTLLENSSEEVRRLWRRKVFLDRQEHDPIWYGMPEYFDTWGDIEKWEREYEWRKA